MLFYDEMGKGQSAAAGQDSPKDATGNGRAGVDRIDIGGSENIDNRGHTKFILLHDGKLASGALKYQNEQTGYWMKTIRPLEEENWRFRFDQNVGQLKHDPQEDKLTVTLDGKTQVFHRKPDTGQQERDLADALLVAFPLGRQRATPICRRKSLSPWTRNSSRRTTRSISAT